MGNFIRYEKNPHTQRSDMQNLKRMLPFVWEYKGRVLFALGCLVAAKLAMVGVPFVLKEIVDTLDTKIESELLYLPLSLLLAYGALRLAGNLFNELRDAIFARVRYRAIRRASIHVLKHLHDLSLSYHLDRKTGGVSRDLDRGTRSISTILNYMIFNIIPTLSEFTLVALILLVKYEIQFTVAVFSTVFLYIAFTLWVTEWRMHFRHEMNAMDSEAN
ncbi:metal ABC transporter permease, partial [Beggiatoa alba]|nr:metal ABC transporter permease [Beggiatoa alba]